MWLTMSSSENLLPSSSSDWHSTVSRSRAVLAAALLDALLEVVLQVLAGLQPAPPRERRHAGADDRVARARGDGEGPVHLGHQFLVGARLVAHEHHRGDVEGELLHRRIQQEAGVVGDPVVGDDLRDHLVDVLGVAGQPGADERLLHDPPVVHVLVEVEEHQAALEERADGRHPALLREVLVAVGVERLNGVGSQRHHRRKDRRIEQRHRSLRAIQMQPVVGAAPEHLDHVTEDRQPVVTHHGLQIAARRWVGPCMLGPVVGQQALLDGAHARHGEEGRRPDSSRAWSRT